MATVRTFDTLAYTKSLIERGFERKQAEALAETNQAFFVNDLATKEFVHIEIKEAVLNLKIWIGGVAVVMTGALATILKLLS